MSIYTEFNDQYGVEFQEMTHEQARKTATLAIEEVTEFLAEFYPEVDITVNLGTVKTENPNLHNAAKELDDIRYVVGQQMDQSGFDVDVIDNEVHSSNMSKALDLNEPSLVLKELTIAQKRYPNAEAVPHDDKYILRDMKTHKVIKPTTYTPAVITDEMLGL